MTVRRELFVPEIASSRGLRAVYGDEAFTTKADGRGQPISSSSQPGIMGPMLEHLTLEPGHRVLEIGAGTGYNAALIKSIVGRRGRVAAIDIDADTARRARSSLRRAGFPVTVVQGDGTKGWREGAPYDRIVVTASSAEIPRAWIDQLKVGGILEVPLRLSRDTLGPQIVVAFVKEGSGLRSRRLIPGGFMTMRHRDGAAAIDWDRIVVQRRVRGEDDVMALSGQRIGSLTDAARRRLSSLIATKPRRRLLFQGVGTRAGGGALYVALGARPTQRLDATGWWASALIDTAGTGVAAIVPRGNTFEPSAKADLVSYSWGSRAVERKLLDLVSEWRSRGRPTWEHLQIRATVGTHHRAAWRRRTHGGTRLCFDWMTG